MGSPHRRRNAHKGTANAVANDMDLFIVMSSDTFITLKAIYESPHDLAAAHWPTLLQPIVIHPLLTVFGPIDAI